MYCVSNRDAYGTNAQNFDTAKRIYVPDELLTRRRRWLKSNFRFGRREAVLSFSVWILLDTSSPPPLFGELSCLKADHPYRGRESCHLKYINSLISRVVIVGFGLHGRTYMCYQRRDHRLVSTVDGPEAPEFRANSRRDQFPRVSIFLFLSTCHLRVILFSNRHAWMKILLRIITHKEIR